MQKYYEKKDSRIKAYRNTNNVGDYPNRKNKLMALGNAVVPQCAELVGRMIKRADELGTMVFDTSIKEEE